MGSNPLGAFKSLNATNMIYETGERRMAINDKRMALSNSVTGNESPGEMMAIAQQDKALNIMGEFNKTMEEVAWAMQKAQEDRKRKARAKAAAAG